MCKPYKDDSYGDSERRTLQESGGQSRWSRNDVEERERWPAKRKNTKLWCKGKVGRKHVPVIEKRMPFGKADEPCGWFNPHWPPNLSKPIWRCFHITVCATCGKHLDKFQHWWGGVGEACPERSATASVS